MIFENLILSTSKRLLLFSEIAKFLISKFLSDLSPFKIYEKSFLAIKSKVLEFKNDSIDVLSKINFSTNISLNAPLFESSLNSKFFNNISSIMPSFTQKF